MSLLRKSLILLFNSIVNFKRDNALFQILGYNRIEGLHDALGTYARTILQQLYSAVWRKKELSDFGLTSWKDLKFNQVCVLIFLPLGCNLVMGYKVKK